MLKKFKGKRKGDGKPAGTGQNKQVVKQEDLPNAVEAIDDSSDELIDTGLKGIVLYDYKPEQEDEIPLVEGQIIIIYERDTSGWWTGEVNGNYGLFPGSFVKVLDESIDATASAPTETKQTEQQTPAPTTTVQEETPAPPTTVTKVTEAPADKQPPPSSNKLEPKEAGSKSPLLEMSPEQLEAMGAEELKAHILQMQSQRKKENKKLKKLKRSKRKVDEENAKLKEAQKKNATLIEKYKGDIKAEVQARSKTERIKEELERVVKTSSSKLTDLETERDRLQKVVDGLKSEESQMEVIKSLRAENARLKSELLKRNNTSTAEKPVPAEEVVEDFVIFNMENGVDENLDALKKKLQQKEAEIAKTNKELQRLKTSASTIEGFERRMNEKLSHTRMEIQSSVKDIKEAVRHQRSSVPTISSNTAS